MATSDPDNRDVLADYIDMALGDSPAAQLWRKLMAVHPDVFRGPTVRGMVDEAAAEAKAAGKAEGYARDRDTGLAIGMRRGEVHGKAEFLLEAIELRDIELTAEQTKRISSCAEEALLKLWLSRVFMATCAEDIFGD